MYLAAGYRHTFLFKEFCFTCGPMGKSAHEKIRAYYPVAGDAGCEGVLIQSIANGPGGAGFAYAEGDLGVGRHFAAPDLEGLGIHGTLKGRQWRRSFYD